MTGDAVAAKVQPHRLGLEHRQHDAPTLEPARRDPLGEVVHVFQRERTDTRRQGVAAPVVGDTQGALERNAQPRLGVHVGEGDDKGVVS